MWPVGALVCLGKNASVKKTPGRNHGPEDSDRRSGRGRRLCRRAYGAGRRGRDLHRSMARACRAHAEARPARHPRQGCRGIHGSGARAACHRRAATGQGNAGRHRLCLHEVLRHRLGHHDDPAISGAGRLRGVAAELHERRDHRRHRRLGQDAGLHRQQHHRQSAGARPHPPRRRQARRGAHRVSRRRSARPHHASGRRKSAAWSATPTAPRSPTICGASAGRNWSPTSWATGCPPAPACPAGEMLQNEPIRRFSTRLGSEAIRVGQAHGYQLEEILHLPPETIARAGEGDEAAMRACDEQRFKDGKRTASGAASLDGPGHAEGPAHRDRIPQRLRGARGREARHHLQRQCRADGYRQARGTQRAEARIRGTSRSCG